MVSPYVRLAFLLGMLSDKTGTLRLQDIDDLATLATDDRV
jgi:hypothetical protein